MSDIPLELLQRAFRFYDAGADGQYDYDVAVPLIRDKIAEISLLTRVEVIDEKGRAYVADGVSVRLDYQDDGRTLKVFVTRETDKT